MKKCIAVMLNTVPENGGIFQYTIAMLDALAALDPDRYRVFAFTRNKRWRAIAAERGIPSPRIAKFGYGEVRKWLARLPVPSWREAASRWWGRFDPFRRSMEKRQVELVIFPGPFPALPLPAGIRQIACIHDLMHRYESSFPEVGDPEEHASRERVYTTMLERCAGILVDSETGKRHVLESYAAEAAKVFALPYIVYSGLKTAVPTRPPSLPEGIEGRYLYYPAQFWAHKNHSRLLEAVASLRRELDIRCVFSGDTGKNGYAAFVESVGRLGLEQNVHCLGYVTEGEMSWLYRHARCMIMPTFFGPTNLPPLEAMHFGCPVGVSGIYGMPEQLGDAAMYFDPHSVEDMARVIRQLWTDEALRAKCVQRGAAVAQAHSAENFSAGLARIIQTVLQRDPS